MSAAVAPLKRPGGEFGATGSVALDAAADDVLCFVADLERQPEWHAGVKAARVLDSRGNQQTVEQTLGWHFLALRGDMTFRLLQTVDARSRSITTQLLRGTMMRSFGSRVGVHEVGPRRCVLEMDLFMRPSVFVPPGVRPFVGRQVRRQLHGVLTSLKAALAARAAAPPDVDAAASDAGGPSRPPSPGGSWARSSSEPPSGRTSLDSSVV